jgi:uncharacterized protein YbjT (DUF2867 family)
VPEAAWPAFFLFLKTRLYLLCYLFNLPDYKQKSIRMKQALVIGATGLVGRSLVEQLLDDGRFEKVVVFVRRSMNLEHSALEEHIVDFDRPETWQHLVKGDVLFSTLGTTLKKAGSKAAQYKVDHSYQFQFAAAAARNAVPVYVLVSAMGASLRSPFFYSRMKAELERDVKELAFSRIVILRPGPLDGPRRETRKGEKIALAAIKTINRLGLFRKYRPIMDHEVARAMIHAALAGKKGLMVVEGEALFRLALKPE